MNTKKEKTKQKTKTGCGVSGVVVVRAQLPRTKAIFACCQRVLRCPTSTIADRTVRSSFCNHITATLELSFFLPFFFFFFFFYSTHAVEWTLARGRLSLAVVSAPIDPAEPTMRQLRCNHGFSVRIPAWCCQSQMFVLAR